MILYENDLPNEVWKDVENYEGYYKVSNMGRVRSLQRGKHGHDKILQPAPTPAGYMHLSLEVNKERTQPFIHELVAKAFVDGWFEGAEVDHKNRIRDDNKASNLEWVTHQENLDRAEKRCVPVIQLDKETGEIIARHESLNAAARSVGISNTDISHCLKNYKGQLTAGGYKWELA